jgi:hypothetical protein
MNYYAQGGQAYGLKSLAQELPKYGRYGDDVVAHISSDEARMLQAMGGSGTINPQTGLPEFFIKKIARPFVQGIKAVQNIPGIKQVSNVATQAFKPIDQALVGLDKTVGKAIPGGWGTVAAIAASMIPGGQFAAGGKLAGLGLSKSAALGGLGALTGSGILRPEGKFNLQGALVGGALAYGSAELMAGLEGAAKPTVDAAGNLTTSGTQSALTGTSAGYTPSPFLSGTSVGAGQSVLTPTANALANVGEFVAPAVTGGTSGGISGLTTAAAPIGINAAIPAAGTASIGLGNIAAKQGTMEALSSFGKDYLANVSNVGTGAKNLLTGAPGATAGFKAAGATLSNTALPIAFGLQGLASMDEQRNFLKEQQAAGNIAQAEYDAAMAEINRSEAIARDAVARNPFDTNPDRSATIGDTDYRRADADENLYGRFDPSERLYAKGGEVPGYFFGGGIGSGFSARAEGEAQPNSGGVGGGFFSVPVRAIIDQLQKNIPTSSTPAGVGFQNLRSEGMPSLQGNSQGIGSLANAIRGALTQSSNTPVDLGDTLYDRRSEKNRIYDELMGRNYAVGGSIDDSPGIDEARGLYQGNMSNGFMNMGSTPAYDKGGKVSTSNSDKKRRDYLDMLNAEFMSPPSQYVEGMGFMSPPQSVGGRLGANLDALGGNLRAGLSGTAMRDQEGNIRTMPGMLDVGYKGQVGPGELDVGLQRAIRAMPGRNKDYALNAKYSVKFAEGGQPRFLSGGGDGMSDSIKASINGTQEARLADGEFVIPADVVSHLGNGSSKAGAKRLYSMMDKVRSARTGTKRQGKQINPKQFMPV